MTDAIVIAAGGTGGHMFPALAVVEALRRRGRRVTLLTDRRGARYAPDDPDCRIVEATSPSGGLVAKTAFAAALARGVLTSLKALREVRPAAAAVFGGYGCVPPALAAALLRVPLVVHEQNAILGRANRLIARFAGKLALSFPRTQGLPSGRPDAVVTGNPVRRGFAVPASRAGRSDRLFRLLVLGGSQGARIFSDVVPAAIANLPAPQRARLRVAQQCRPEDLERVRRAYAGAGFEAELAPFFEDVPSRMAAAGLVVARSGASTVAELLACARASLLVPYPHAADDHQMVNARALEEEGAAIVIAQAEFSAERLAAVLEDLMGDGRRLEAMELAARSLARPDAAERLADLVLELARPEGPR